MTFNISFTILLVAFFQTSSGLAVTNHFTPQYGTPILVDDFNGDGNLDVLTASGAQQRFYIYSGTADGKFSRGGMCYQPSMRSQRIFSVDLNGDGYKDYVVLQGEYLFIFPGSEKAFCGQPKILKLEQFAVSEIVAGDFDGNGQRELLAIDSYNGKVRRLKMGSVEFNFSATGEFSLGFTQVGKVLLLKSPDSAKDQILALDTVLGTLHTYEFRKNRLVEIFKDQVGPYPFTMATADLEGFGEVKLLVALRAPNSVRVFARNDKGHWQSEGKPIPLGASPVFIEVADFDGDGEMDILVAEDFAPQVQIFLKNDKDWHLKSTVSLSGSPRSVKVMDINHDGKLDFAVATTQSVDIVIF